MQALFNHIQFFQRSFYPVLHQLCVGICRFRGCHKNEKSRKHSIYAGFVGVTKNEKSRKPSIYAGFVGVTNFWLGVTKGVTFLKSLENLVFMRVSGGVTNGTDRISSVEQI